MYKLNRKERITMNFPVTILIDQISTNEKFTVNCETDSDMERIFKVAHQNDDCFIVGFIDADDNHFGVSKK